METITQQALSTRILQLPESATIKMAQLGRELKAEGKDIISLSLGEPDFETPEHIKDAAKKAVTDGYSHYSPVPGYLELRKAISDKFKRDNGLDYSADQIVVSTGAKQSIVNVMLCLVNPGDEVIVPAPYWVSYEAMVQLAEASMVNIDTDVENDFKITPQQLEDAITDKTKVLLYSSPCNPTGSVYTKDELEGIARVIEKYPQIYVISDEIYEFINYTDKHESIAQFEFIKDQVITVNGFSKGFAMTGWRVGYIGAPLTIAKACSKMQGQFTSGTCSIAQKAAEAALTSTMEPTYEMKAVFKKRRSLIMSLFQNIPGVRFTEPAGAFYLFPDVSSYFNTSCDGKTISNADDLALFLLEDANVSLVTGSAFGAPNCIRISYAASEEAITDAVNRISNSLVKLKPSI